MVVKRNQCIHQEAKKRRVKLWEIADHMGIFDTAFSKMLRKELPTDKQAEILAVIDKIAANREG